MKKTLIIFFVLISKIIFGQEIEKYPFSTNNTNITIWNGTEYVPFFVKGVNLGVSVPGTFPGELAATKSDYSRWFKLIKDAGFNCIRLYTLHYPRFYEVLDSFNIANSHNPLLFFQGVWLNEDLPDYQNNLYFMSDTFKVEIGENIDCIYGNKFIPERQGKAFGQYSTNASQWCIGYIIGREVYPEEIIETDSNNMLIANYIGNHFSIFDATASECWFTKMLDYTVKYEFENYGMQRPVSNSSWPTLDPMPHPEEVNRNEDMAHINLSKVQLIDAPAGLFICYHAYPYYPDFVSLQSSYQIYFDNYGTNSYLGYLTELKSHYTQFPLIIAEYGVPSSWGIAHYSSSGMNHGGYDEYEQGLNNIRLLNTIEAANCGGGIQFAWIDEWFKRTWITDPIDYTPDSRILWHNIVAAEQNYGLIGYKHTFLFDTICIFDTHSDIKYIVAEVNQAFFELEIGLNNPLDIPDKLWISLDTYDEALGETILPTGDTIPFRSEFALEITNYSAQLLVTQAYDIFGIWHGQTNESQLFRSIPSEGKPWEIVRIKNNYSHSDVQYIGNMQINYGFQPISSKDAVVIFDDKIRIKIPWSYINFVAPDKMKVLHDYKNSISTNDTVSDGIAVAILYKNNWYNSPRRIVWDTWNSFNAINVEEYIKTSYYVMTNSLTLFNTPPIAVKDSYSFNYNEEIIYVSELEGLLNNDFDLDGDNMVSLIVENPQNGQIFLNPNGSFSYIPYNNHSGFDSFKYSVYDGISLSEPNIVEIEINNSSTQLSQIQFYPNPCYNYFHIKSDDKIEKIDIYNSIGQRIDKIEVKSNSKIVDISNYEKGYYSILVTTNKKIIAKNIFVTEN